MFVSRTSVFGVVAIDQSNIVGAFIMLLLVGALGKCPATGPASDRAAASGKLRIVAVMSMFDSRVAKAREVGKVKLNGKSIIAVIVCVLFGLPAAVAVHAVPGYYVTDLGTLEGTESAAYGINSSGFKRTVDHLNAVVRPQRPPSLTPGVEAGFRTCLKGSFDDALLPSE